MSSVTLKNVYKYYEKNPNPAVSNFNLDIKDKEFIVFVGPSGCGKSTTLRMVAGLEEISEGTISIGKKVVNDVEPKNRDIAMVFQNYALYPHMTVYDNIAFGLRLKKINNYKVDRNKEKVYFRHHYTKEEVDAKVQEAAKILEITEYLDRRPKALSGGQRQRVAIGRAIVRKPKVFLMDEPLSNLDAKLRHQMRSELILLRKRINTTFIYVTHDQVEAMTLGDRIVVMKGGVIQQVGTPMEVFDKPKNVFVAGFIGTPHMNFLNGTLDKDLNLFVNGSQVELADSTKEALKKVVKGPMNVTVGIRPEHITVSEKGTLKAQVNIYEMMGSEYHLHSSIGEDQLVIRVNTMGIDPKVEKVIAEHGTLNCSLNKYNIHLFSKETGESLL